MTTGLCKVFPTIVIHPARSFGGDAGTASVKTKNSLQYSTNWGMQFRTGSDWFGNFAQESRNSMRGSGAMSLNSLTGLRSTEKFAVSWPTSSVDRSLCQVLALPKKNLMGSISN